MVVRLVVSNLVVHTVIDFRFFFKLLRVGPFSGDHRGGRERRSRTRTSWTEWRPPRRCRSQANCLWNGSNGWKDPGSARPPAWPKDLGTSSWWLVVGEVITQARLAWKCRPHPKRAQWLGDLLSMCMKHIIWLQVKLNHKNNNKYTLC